MRTIDDVRDGFDFLAGNERVELDALREFVALSDTWQWPLSAERRVEIRIFGGRPTYRELVALGQHIDVLIDSVKPRGEPVSEAAVREDVDQPVVPPRA